MIYEFISGVFQLHKLHKQVCGPILLCVQTVGKEARPNIIPIHTNGARKGPSQYPVRGQTKVRGQPFLGMDKIAIRGELKHAGEELGHVRGRWSPRDFCPRYLVNSLITQNNAWDKSYN